MAPSSPAEYPVPDTAATVRVEHSDEYIDFSLGGDLSAQDAGTVEAVLKVLVDRSGEDPKKPVRLLAHHPPDQIHRLPTLLAQRLGLEQTRDLFQMRRPLPIPANDPGRNGTPPLNLRAFDPQADAGAWVRTNNRAFAHHPDQGTQTLATLQATLTEPWLDLDGFLVTDDPDRPEDLAGFCWTRIHPAGDEDPEFGEIFVIGVDPRHHGHRLGQALVLAGLDHLAWKGVRTAMLYVEADNEAALRLYERLGFVIHFRYRVSAA